MSRFVLVVIFVCLNFHWCAGSTVVPIPIFQTLKTNDENGCVTFHCLGDVLKLFNFDNKMGKELLAPLYACLPKEYSSFGNAQYLIHANFTPTGVFEKSVKDHSRWEMTICKSDELPTMKLNIKSQANFIWGKVFYYAGEKDFYMPRSTKRIPFVKSEQSMFFSESENGFYLKVPLGARNSKKEQFYFEIWQLDVSSGAAELNVLKKAATATKAVLFFPKIKVSCCFDFLKITPNLSFRGIHDHVPVHIIKNEERTTFEIGERGISFETQMQVILQGIGRGAESEKLREIIVDRPFYFSVSSSEGMYCFGRVVCP